jgi:hypothetical protein
MQIDMHYYGVYALARMAGLNAEASKTVATASQFVDDAVYHDLECHSDGSRLAPVVTSHRIIEIIENSNPKDQPFVWVPFHFFPGNEGDSFTERLICRKDSNLVNEMIDRYIEMAGLPFALELMGLAAHEYMDTFSHYGFSGVSSRKNRVVADSIVAENESKQVIKDKLDSFCSKYGHQRGLWPNIKETLKTVANWRERIRRSIMSDGAEILSGALGHGAVAVFPDLPYLKWRFTYEETVPAACVRNNRETFLEGCEKLCKVFRRFLAKAGDGTQGVAFDTVRSRIKDILSLKKEKEERCEAWREAYHLGELGLPAGQQIPHYQETLWTEQKDRFASMPNPGMANQLEVYRFYQAASFHQHYVLRELLPKHGLIVV